MYKPALVFEVTFKPEAKLANGIGTDAVKTHKNLTVTEHTKTSFFTVENQVYQIHEIPLEICRRNVWCDWV